jgi:hypothetical protein
LRVAFRDGRAGGAAVLHNGVTTIKRDAGGLHNLEHVIVLDATLDPTALRATMLHELQHVHDNCDVDARALPRIKRERRAILYAARAMGGWR